MAIRNLPEHRGALPAASHADTLTTYVMDTGSWLTNRGHSRRSFGVVSGDEIVLAELDDTVASLDKQVHHVKGASLKKLFPPTSPMHAQDGNAPAWNLRILSHVQVAPAPGDPGSQMMCGAGALYVFIPDLHICLGADDPVSFFSNPADYNAKLLGSFLTHCKSVGATIVQTGDLFDVWMAEAQRKIYFTNSADKPGTLLYEGPWLTQMGTTIAFYARDRRARATLAVREIARTASPIVRDALKLIDHYIPGNHDWELTMMQDDAAELFDALLPKATIYKDHGSPWTIPDTRIEVQHGHFHDDYNDTRSVSSLDEMMCKVDGKPITFGFARGRRGEDRPEHWRADGCDKGFSVGLAEKSNNWAGAGAEWIVDHNTFGEVRNGMLEHYVDTYLGQGFALQFEFDVVAFRRGTRMALYDPSKANVPSPKVRLLIHSHTHSPLLTKLLVLPVSAIAPPIPWTGGSV